MSVLGKLAAVCVAIVVAWAVHPKQDLGVVPWGEADE